MTWFIPGKSPIRVSQVHRPVVIDDDTGKPACPPFEGKHTHVEVYEFWPSELQRVFVQAGIPRRTPPRNEDCIGSGDVGGDPPAITSPLRGSIYTLRLKPSAENRIAFTANADASVREMYWFVDDAYVGSTAPGESLFWQPGTAGSYEVRVVDDHGRSDLRPLGVSLVD
jgi:penicillin-binding protein 1C